MTDETDGSEDAFWSLDQALNWIAFRRPSPAEHETRRRRLYSALVLDHRDQEGLVVGNPARILKLRLEEGKIIARGRDGSEFAPAFWAHLSFDITGWPKVVLKKDDVVTAFPEKEANAVSQPPAAPPARPSHEAITAEIKNIYANAKAPDAPMNKRRARAAIEAKLGHIMEKEWNPAFANAGVRRKGGRPPKVPQKPSENI